MDPSLEIRKLPPSVIKDLVNILEFTEYWKRLMSIIPKTLERNDYKCKVSTYNPPKYKSKHFRLIESESANTKISCTEILFDEWGTSGRVRPTLGHLLYLLTEAQAYSAAEYVAVQLLNQDPPERPKDGPAAAVTAIDLKQLITPKQAVVEKVLDQINYSSSLLNHINDTTADVNIDYRDDSTTVREKPKVLVIPEIVISESRDECPSDLHVPLVIPRRKNSDASNSDNENVPQHTEDGPIFTVEDNLCGKVQVPQISKLLGEKSEDITVLNADLSSIIQTMDSTDNVSVSDMIQFSSNENSSLNNNTDSISNAKLPDSSLLHFDEDESNKAIVKLDSNNMENSERVSDYVPPISELMSSSRNIPNFSALLPTNGCDKNNQSQIQDNLYLPVFSALNTDSQSSKSDLSDNSDISVGKFERRDRQNFCEPSDNRRPSLNTQLSHFSNVSGNNSRNTCASPLPNLSLNTILQHFSYCELEIATNRFDKAPHINSLVKGNNEEERNGRFLGSGAFGSVFLALGLLEKPVAVKKLYLNNPDFVDVDDPVTKQFKKEVEVLYKYKHENLVSLIGYSCDGPTFCLLYEYISGGALKDRLQNQKQKLPWEDRLHIALGTAKAVAYLHTAFSTPLIHRDIKSANILLDSSGKPKLCDFGLIKMTHSQQSNTSTTISGTSAYMAPEAFRGDVSVKMDTFSFGVVLLELLTALPPYDPDREGNDLVTHIMENCDQEVIIHLLDHNAGSWETKNKNYGNALFQIASKCLEEKRRRPEMVDVIPLLMELLDDI